MPNLLLKTSAALRYGDMPRIAAMFETLFPKGASSEFRVRLIALVDLQVLSLRHCQTLIASEGVNLFSESKESPLYFCIKSLRGMPFSNVITG
jgi:hypothetical protein